MSDLAHAKRWADALSSDVDALIELYRHEDHELAQGFTSEHSMIDDNMKDTFSTKDELRQAYGGYSSGQNGKYTFTATEGASTFRGLPVPEGTVLETVGSTFQTLDADGKIAFESTYWEDNRAFKQLGIAILTPHYWDEDFNMEEFLASLAA
jgi:hypothetical protein